MHQPSAHGPDIYEYEVCPLCAVQSASSAAVVQYAHSADSFGKCRTCAVPLADCAVRRFITSAARWDRVRPVLEQMVLDNGLGIGSKLELIARVLERLDVPTSSHEAEDEVRAWARAIREVLA